MDRASLERLLSEGSRLPRSADASACMNRRSATGSEKHGLVAVNRSEHVARGRIRAGGAGGAGRRGTLGRADRRVGSNAARRRCGIGWRGMGSVRRAGRALVARGRARGTEAGLSEATLETAHITVRTPMCANRVATTAASGVDQEAVVRRRRKVKAILVSEAGGCCRLCGYDRCAAALEFHHLDRADKGLRAKSRVAWRAVIERLRAEARKCVLLCSNCHAEVENGFSSVQ